MPSIMKADLKVRLYVRHSRRSRRTWRSASTSVNRTSVEAGLQARLLL